MKNIGAIKLVSSSAAVISLVLVRSEQVDLTVAVSTQSSWMLFYSRRF